MAETNNVFETFKSRAAKSKKKEYDYDIDSVAELTKLLPQVAKKKYGETNDVNEVVGYMTDKLGDRLSPQARKLFKREAKIAYGENGFGIGAVERPSQDQTQPQVSDQKEKAPDGYIDSAYNYAANSLKAFGGGVTKSFSDTPRAIGYALGSYEADDGDGKTSFGEGLQRLADTIDLVDEPDPEFANTGVGQFFSAMGEVVGLVGTTIATLGSGTAVHLAAKGVVKGAALTGSKKAAKKLADDAAKVAAGGQSKVFKIIPAAAAASQGAVAEVDRYIADRRENGEEINDNTAKILLMGGAAMGLVLESALPTTLSNRLNSIRGSVTERTLKILADKGSAGKLFKRALGAAAEEGTTEAMQAVGSHYLAQALYEEDKELFTDLVNFKNEIGAQAATGAGVGAVLSVTFDGLSVLLAGRRLKKTKLPNGEEVYDGDDTDVPVSGNETIEGQNAASAEELGRQALSQAVSKPAYLRSEQDQEALAVARSRVGFGDYIDKMAEDSGLPKTEGAENALQAISEAANSNVPPSEIVAIAKKQLKSSPRTEGFLRSLEQVFDSTTAINQDEIGVTSLTHGELIGRLFNKDDPFYADAGISPRQASQIAKAAGSDNIDVLAKAIDGVGKKSKGNTKKLLKRIGEQVQQAKTSQSVQYGGVSSSNRLNTGDGSLPSNSTEADPSLPSENVGDVVQAINSEAKRRKDQAATTGNQDFSTVYAAIKASSQSIDEHRKFFLDGGKADTATISSDYALGLHLNANFGSAEKTMRWMGQKGWGRVLGLKGGDAELLGLAQALSDSFNRAIETGDYSGVEGGEWYKTYKAGLRGDGTAGPQSDLQPLETDVPNEIKVAIREQLAAIRKMFRPDQAIPSEPKLDLTASGVAARLSKAGIGRDSIVSTLRETGVSPDRMKQIIASIPSAATSRAARSNALDIANADQRAANGGLERGPAPDDGIDYSSLTGQKPLPKNMFDRYRMAKRKASGEGVDVSASENLARNSVPDERPAQWKQSIAKWMSLDGRLAVFGELGREAANVYKSMAGVQHWRAATTKANAERTLGLLQVAIDTAGIKKGYKGIPAEDKKRFYASLIDSEIDPPDYLKEVHGTMRKQIDSRSGQIIDVLTKRHEFIAAKFGDGSQQEIDASVEFDAIVSTLENNMGSYVNRSYRIHDNFNDWRKKLDAEVVVDGQKRSRLEHIIVNDNYWRGYEDLTVDERRTKAVDLIAAHTPTDDGAFADFVSSLQGSKDILREREDVPDWARSVLGEKTDPIESYVGTISKMDEYLARAEVTNKFMDSLFTASLLRTNNADGDENFVPASTVKSFEHTAFKDFYIDSAAVDAMAELGPPGTNDPAVAISNVINGHLKIMMTVGNVDTHIRNAFGAMTAVAANGNLSFPTMARATAHAKNIYKLSGNKVPDEHIEFLLKERIIQESANADEIFQAFKNNDWDTMVSSINNGLDALPERIRSKKPLDLNEGVEVNPFKKAGFISRGSKAVGDVYRFPDGFFRYVNYLAEYERNIESGMPEQEAKLDAAKRTRETMPGSSEVPLFVKRLRSPSGWKSGSVSWALINPFLTATVSAVYTTGNRVKRAHEDIASGDPARRSGGVRALMATGLVLGMLEEWANPDDDDDRIYLREHWEAMSEHERGLGGRIEGIDDAGNIIINRTHWSNTYSPITAISSIMTAKDITTSERATQAFRHVVNELGGQSITVELLQKLYAAGHKSIEDDSNDPLLKVMQEAGLKFFPKEITDFIKMSKLSEVTDEGQRAILNKRLEVVNSARTLKAPSDPFRNIGYSFRNKVGANDNALKSLFKDVKNRIPTSEEIADQWIEGEAENLEYLKATIKKSERWRGAIYKLNGQGVKYKPDDVFDWLTGTIKIKREIYDHLVRSYHNGTLDQMTVADTTSEGIYLFDNNMVDRSLDKLFKDQHVAKDTQKIRRQQLRDAQQVIRDKYESGELRDYAKSLTR